MTTELVKPNVALNEIHLNKKGKDIILDAQVSDDFGISLSQAIGFIVAGQMGFVPQDRRPAIHDKTPRVTSQLSLPGTNPSLMDQDETPIEGEILTDAPNTSSGSNPDRDKMKEIFTYEGEAKDRLRLDETDLKAAGQLAYSKRLAHLFLYAHNLEGREFVSKAQLKEVVEQDAVYDPNFINWINTSSDLRVEDEKVRLRKSGRENAVKYLHEVSDKNISGKWMPDTKPRKQNKGNTANGDASEPNPKPAQRNAGGGSKVVSEWEAKWKSLGLKINGFELFNTRPLPDKLAFGLWAISKALNNPQLIASGARIVDFLYQTFGIKMSQGGHIDKALSSKAAAGKVVKDKGGYRLLEPGVKYIEQICDPTNGSKPNPNPAKKATTTTK